MKCNRFNKTVAFKEGFIDWVRASPAPWTGAVQEKFYRGRIRRVIWEGALPRISLIEIKRFYPASGRWRNANFKPAAYVFDFADLQRHHIHFTSSDYKNGKTRFMILFGTTGIIIPKSGLPAVHSLAPYPSDELSKKTSLI